MNSHLIYLSATKLSVTLSLSRSVQWKEKKEKLKLTGIQCCFWHCHTCRFFSRFTQTFDDVIACRWLNHKIHLLQNIVLKLLGGLIHKVVNHPVLARALNPIRCVLSIPYISVVCCLCPSSCDNKLQMFGSHEFRHFGYLWESTDCEMWFLFREIAISLCQSILVSKLWVAFQRSKDTNLAVFTICIMNVFLPFFTKFSVT